jgi:hypothetical protein
LHKDGVNFKDKRQLPLLQAADMLAWTVYRAMLHEIKDKDAKDIAKLTFKNFYAAKNYSLLEGGYNK